MEGLNSLKLFTPATGDQKVGEYTLKIISINHGGNCWHRKASFIILKGSSLVCQFDITAMVSGCGVSIISNIITNINPFDVIPIIEKIFNLYKEDGCGVFITTFGQGHYISYGYRLLEKLGFKVLSEYPNYRHGEDGGYKQKLLQLIL